MLLKNGSIACEYCGKFISIAELERGEAEHYLLTPDSELTKEDFESYHHVCFEKSK
jgi:hypothetical protein